MKKRKNIIPSKSSGKSFTKIVFVINLKRLPTMKYRLSNNIEYIYSACIVCAGANDVSRGGLEGYNPLHPKGLQNLKKVLITQKI